MKKTGILPIALAMMLLVSCEKHITTDFVVDNNSGKPILVTYETYDNSMNDTLVEGNQKNVRFYFIESSGQSAVEHPVTSYLKYFSVEQDTIPSKVNYYSNDNWIYTKHSDSHEEYKVVVNPTDFNQ
jgi:hypothetical protein